MGTDVSDLCIRNARIGIYPESSLDGVSAERLKVYFVRIEGGYQIAKFVRDLCLFAVHDICKDPPFSKLDLIICRNVLIYMGQALQSRAIESFHYGLNPKGHLMLGHSESMSGYAKLFESLDSVHKLFTKKASRVSLATERAFRRFMGKAPGPLTRAAVSAPLLSKLATARRLAC